MDPIFDLAKSEPVDPPRRVVPPPNRESAVLVTTGIGLGAAVLGPPGALLGGAVGCVVDAVRRRLLTR